MSINYVYATSTKNQFSALRRQSKGFSQIDVGLILDHSASSNQPGIIYNLEIDPTYFVPPGQNIAMPGKKK